MFDFSPNDLQCRRALGRTPRAESLRIGLTLIELLMAMSVMTLMVGGLATLAHTVATGQAYTQGHATSSQHGRVAMEHISRAINQANANESFPGAYVFADMVGSYRFPDTLVVWNPSSGNPANPTGLPLYSEIVVYCPNPTTPNQLWEITSPGDSRTVPALTDTSGWTSALTALKASTSTAQKTVLTDLLRSASTNTNGDLTKNLRGAARFEMVQHPSATEWASYRAGSTAWSNLTWVQWIYGSQSGLAQTWIRYELQLMPGSSNGSSSSSAGSSTAAVPLDQIVPYLGSGAVYYQLSQ